MDIGFGAAVAGAWATPRNLAELGRRAERLGYRSLWTFQRLLVPAGTELAPVYQSVLDPMVALGYLAAATSSIRLGVAVVNHPFASPLLLAKQAATVDVLSGGRLDLGIGSGWLAEEFTGSGASMAGRGARADEYVAALRALWGGSAGFQGKFFTIPPGRQDPKPAQRQGPPILIGGMSRAAMERAGRIGDGWVTASSADLSTIAESAKVVQTAAGAAGRGPARIVCRGVVRPGKPSVSKTTGKRHLLSGSYEQIREDIGWLESCGVTEVFYDLNFDPAVGDPAADEGKAVLRASEILEALAPDARLLAAVKVRDSSISLDGMEKVERTEAEWREMLSPGEYAVLRKAGTEPAFTGEYTDTDTVGVYRCKACGAELFRSDAKFHSGCGWPSFYQPTGDDAVTLIEDRSHGMIRVEARCARCDSHLGHVFTGEGYSTPTDERWCINSVSLTLEPAES